jgi:hypothetical protein
VNPEQNFKDKGRTVAVTVYLQRQRLMPLRLAGSNSTVNNVCSKRDQPNHHHENNEQTRGQRHFQ